MRHARTMARQLLPGVALPGLIYLLVSQHVSVLVALAAASSVPLLDAVYRAVTRRAQSPVGLIFLAMTAGSVGLALWLRSPMFILAKGAVVSALIGLTFTISALVRRPLTRTLAVALSTECPRGRASLRRTWAHPAAVSVFCTLSAGWGILLLLSAIQQAALALTLSPGVVMTLEPPVQLVATVAGVAVSVLYVRRRQRLSPELRVLPIPIPAD
ncbi:MAG TPA: VC0807 family protein [Actinomycetota bacterium]|nr:VC0807 family protein [Actinomycetota bacterium]